jgi:hypothetical protein
LRQQYPGRKRGRGERDDAAADPADDVERPGLAQAAPERSHAASGREHTQEHQQSSDDLTRHRFLQRHSAHKDVREVSDVQLPER